MRIPKDVHKIHRKVLAGNKKHIRHVKRIVRHPLFTIPTATFIVLLSLGAVGIISISGGKPNFRPSDTYVVIVTHDGTQQTVPTRAPTVGVLLSRLHITLNTGDVVEPAKNTPIIEQDFRVNVYRAVPVEIIDGAQHTYTYSAAATPRSIVQEAGVSIYPEDDVSVVPTQNFLTDDAIGERVVVDPATPVDVNLFGTPAVVRTHATTIAELLKDEKIKLGTGDTVTPDPTTPISPDLQVFLTHQGTQIQTVTQSIPTPVQTVQDSSLSFGTTVVRQQGSPGSELITYQLNLQNGKVIGKSQIQTVVTVQPVAEIIAQGQAVQIPTDQQAIMALAGIPAGDYAYVSYIVSHESGWCPTKLQGDIGYCPGYPPDPIPSYLGYGLGQATPGTKMAAYGSDWETNPVTQLKWANAYANATYGGWANAYDHWQAYSNW
jgi:uncharacterized protein YabE (DUF348 family)